MAQQLYIEQATYISDCSVLLVFNDGKKQVVDFGKFLDKHPHPQYNKYKRPQKFKTFYLDGGNIVWGKNWDLIFPVEHLYCGEILV
ncbi:hypothetical protein FACS1894156_4440 [Bacteroidia bacterium]|nr:hypothetical protein FACS1894156_4440 [Bacteroidia bacterium]